MSVGMDRLREQLADYLNGCDIPSVTAWQGGGRGGRDRPVVAVSMRGCTLGAGGFQHYLGERQNSETGAWENLYGRLARVTLGLDIYAPHSVGEVEIQRTFDALVEGLTEGSPCGLNLDEISCGETSYDAGERVLCRPVEAVCQTYLYAVATEGERFLNFEVRGGIEQ